MKHTKTKILYVLIALFLFADLGLLVFLISISTDRNQVQKQANELQKQLTVLEAALETEAEPLTEVENTEADESRTDETADTVSEATEVAASETGTQKTDDTETDMAESGTPAASSDLSARMDSLADTFLNEPESRGETWSISMKNLSNGSYAGYHDDTSMQSASVIKVFIMAAVYSEICYPEPDAEALYFPEQYDGELRDLLVNMITVSDNTAANRLVEGLGNGDFQTGSAVVNQFCQENGYTNTSLGRRFLEENPSGDNYTSAADCCRILSDIYSGSCVCPEASQKMLDLLKGQTRKEKIPSGLPNGIQSANKTGEMPEGYGLGCIENDIAIIFGENEDYILCILSNNLSGNNEGAKERIRQISARTYESFN